LKSSPELLSFRLRRDKDFGTLKLFTTRESAQNQTKQLQKAVPEEIYSITFVKNRLACCQHPFWGV
jgi:hypothetical protein